jgi:lipoic acid synthetase
MSPARRPPWLRKKITLSVHNDMETLLAGLGLRTACKEAHCPNISECYGKGQATFLILGVACTRMCSFCNVAKRTPLPPDPDEPARIAEAIRLLDLRHAVITSPTRDDLPDGGASFFSDTVRTIRAASPKTAIELLIPDFGGKLSSLEAVVTARPDILGHNLETVPRLYHIRAGADYRRSLALLNAAKEMESSLRTKSGIMLGMGEEEEEVFKLFSDLLENRCGYLSIGQYLAPGRHHHPVREYIQPETFDRYREKALSMGFLHVESGPYVRSSYHAELYGQAN